MLGKNVCYSKDVCGCSKFICWNPNDETFGKWLGHKGGLFMNGVSALKEKKIKEKEKGGTIVPPCLFHCVRSQQN